MCNDPSSNVLGFLKKSQTNQPLDEIDCDSGAVKTLDMRIHEPINMCFDFCAHDACHSSRLDDQNSYAVDLSAHQALFYISILKLEALRNDYANWLRSYRVFQEKNQVRTGYVLEMDQQEEEEEEADHSTPCTCIEGMSKQAKMPHSPVMPLNHHCGKLRPFLKHCMQSLDSVSLE